MTTETPKARQAWADYLALGPGRSLEKLVEQYRLQRQFNGNSTAPTVHIRQLEIWSSAFGWQERLSAIAEQEARVAVEKEAAYRRSIMESGYAQSHARVEALNAMAIALHDDIMRTDDNRRWVKDVKQIGSGEFAERVDIERFNASEVEQFRGLLDDIAKETGGRVNKTELSGPGGSSIPITIIEAVPIPDAG